MRCCLLHLYFVVKTEKVLQRWQPWPKAICFAVVPLSVHMSIHPTDKCHILHFTWRPNKTWFGAKFRIKHQLCQNFTQLSNRTKCWSDMQHNPLKGKKKSLNERCMFLTNNYSRESGMPKYSNNFHFLEKKIYLIPFINFLQNHEYINKCGSTETWPGCHNSNNISCVMHNK